MYRYTDTRHDRGLHLSRRSLARRDHGVCLPIKLDGVGDGLSGVIVHFHLLGPMGDWVTVMMVH